MPAKKEGEHPWRPGVLVEGLARQRLGEDEQGRRLLAAARSFPFEGNALWHLLLQRWTECLLLKGSGEHEEAATLAREALESARRAGAVLWTTRFEALLRGATVALWPDAVASRDSPPKV